MAFTILLSLTQTTTKVRSNKNSLSLRVKLALVAPIFIGPTSRVVLVRLKANLENSCFIPLSKQVQTGSGLALAQTGSNLFELDMYKHVWHSEFCSVL